MHGVCDECKHGDVDINKQPCIECKWIINGDKDNWESKIPVIDWKHRAEVAEKDADRLATFVSEYGAPELCIVDDLLALHETALEARK